MKLFKHPFFRSLFFREVLPFLIIFSIIVFLVWAFSYRSEQLTYNSRYTIATTTKTFYGPNGVKYIGYSFQVHSGEYQGRDRLREGKVPGRYFVKFSVKHPGLIKEFYQDKPVPDHITEAPPEGWEEIPR